MTRARLFWFGKLVVGVGLLWLVVSRFEPRDLGSVFHRLHWGWLAAMVILPHIALLVSAWKWQILLRELGIGLTLVRATGLYLIGTFFNNFLPTTAGGDVARVMGAAERDRIPDVAAATFVERYSGLGALVVSLLFALRVPALTLAVPGLSILVIGAISAYVLGTLWLFWIVRARGEAERRVGGGQASRFFDRVLRTGTVPLSRLSRSRKALWKALGISILFYLVVITTVICACKALSVQVDLLALFGAVPLVLALGVFPISINGLGVSEVGYVFTLSALGASPAEAFSVAILLRGRIFFTSAVGGVLFSLGGWE